MTKFLMLAVMAVVFSFTPRAFAKETLEYLPPGVVEAGDVLLPSQIAEELRQSEAEGDFGEELDAKPMAYGDELTIVVSRKNQRLVYAINGEVKGGWKVSTGLPGYGTPPGTYRVQRMEYTWNSRTYDNARMDRAIFFHDGYALHQTYGKNVNRLGRMASHGCVRQAPAHGDFLYRLVKSVGPQNVTIIIQ